MKPPLIELKAIADHQRQRMGVLTTQLKEQAAQIQRVSAQLAARVPPVAAWLNKFATAFSPR